MCDSNLEKTREWSGKVRSGGHALHKEIKGYKKIANALNLSRDTAGSITHKFNVKGTVAT